MKNSSFTHPESRFSPKKNHFPPMKSQFTHEENHFSPMKNHVSPMKSHFTHEENHFSPMKNHFSPMKNRITHEKNSIQYWIQLLAFEKKDFNFHKTKPPNYDELNPFEEVNAIDFQSKQGN